VIVQYAEQETKPLKHRAELEQKRKLSAAKRTSTSQRKKASKEEAELIALQQDQEESIFEHLPDGQLYHRMDRTRQFVENQRELNDNDDHNLDPNTDTPHQTPKVTLEFSDPMSSVSNPYMQMFHTQSNRYAMHQFYPPLGNPTVPNTTSAQPLRRDFSTNLPRHVFGTD
jgi:adenine-specific DNA glycosylase